MRRKVNLHNFILKTTAGIMTAALIVSSVCFNIDSWVPTVVCFGSALWLGVYFYANGVLDEDGDDE